MLPKQLKKLHEAAEKDPDRKKILEKLAKEE
jgi:hypothetical protein